MKNTNQILLPNEIIELIFILSNIKCHCCNKNYDFNFYKKLNKNYYCSYDCFNFI